MTSRSSIPRAATSSAAVIPIHRGDADAALVEALRDGSTAAGHALFAAYGGYVRRVLMRVLGPDPDLGDLVQDVFVAALESVTKLQNPRALKGWLAQIAVFQARRCLRRRKQWSILRFFGPSEMPDGHAHDADFEGSQALRAAYRQLAKLPVDERIAFTLRFIEGMYLGDVAAACDVSLATTKRRLARAEAAFGALAREEPSLTEWIGGEP